MTRAAGPSQHLPSPRRWTASRSPATCIANTCSAGAADLAQHDRTAAAPRQTPKPASTGLRPADRTDRAERVRRATDRDRRGTRVRHRPPLFVGFRSGARKRGPVPRAWLRRIDGELSRVAHPGNLAFTFAL